MVIFFDLDGTIVDVTDRFYTVYASICDMLCINILSKSEYWRALQLHLNTHDILDLTGGAHAYNIFIAERTNLIEATRFLRLDKLRSGVKSTLQLLSNRFELHLVTLRNSIDNLFWELKLLEIRDFFTSVKTASAFGTVKDKVQLLLSAGARSHKDIIIGDTEIDMLAGKQLYLVTCAVLKGMCTENALHRLKPDYVIREFNEIAMIIQQLTSKEKD